MSSAPERLSASAQTASDLRQPERSLARLRTVSRLLFVVTAVVIAALMLTPQSGLPGIEVNDLLAHGLAFLGLALLGALAFHDRRSSLACALGLILMGGLLEALQALTPDRQASVADAIANLVGVGVGLVAGRAGYALLRKGLRHRAPPVSGARSPAGHRRATPAAGRNRLPRQSAPRGRPARLP